MKVNINFKFFSQNVSVGYCLILLGMTIAGAYAAVIRPDMRWILILMVFFTDFFCVFDIGRICRSYDICTDGVVAIWFGIFRRFYPWSSFCSVSWERVNLGCRVVTGVLCTQIPLKRQRNGMVDKNFLGWHPFRVLDIDMTEEQLSEFSKYYPIQLGVLGDEHEKETHERETRERSRDTWSYCVFGGRHVHSKKCGRFALLYAR